MGLDFLDQLEAEAAQRRADCPSDFVLDGLLCGTLTGDAASAVRAHLDTHAACAERYAAMQIEPPLNDVKILSTLAQAQTRPWWRRLFDVRVLGGLVAVAGAAAAVMLMTSKSPIERGPQTGVRVKGQLKLELRKKRGDVVERVAAGDAITATDRVRFVVSLPGARQIGVVGVESNGTLYTAWPIPGQTPETTRGPGKGIELPGAVSFEGQGEERLYLVACPVEVAPVCKTSGAKTPPTCPDGCALSEFFIRLE